MNEWMNAEAWEIPVCPRQLWCEIKRFHSAMDMKQIKNLYNRAVCVCVCENYAHDSLDADATFLLVFPFIGRSVSRHLCLTQRAAAQQNRLTVKAHRTIHSSRMVVSQLKSFPGYFWAMPHTVKTSPSSRNTTFGTSWTSQPFQMSSKTRARLNTFR